MAGVERAYRLTSLGARMERREGSVERSTIRSLFASAVALFTFLAAPAKSLAIDEFPLAAGSNPASITVGPDGALWFTEEGRSKIGRIDPATKAVAEYPPGVGTTASPPAEITTGPDGALWFTEYNVATGGSKIGRITTAGAITEFSLPSFSQPDGITAAPPSDPGALWFTEFGPDKLGRIPTTATSGSDITHPVSLPSGSDPSDITVGPPADGRLWFTEEGTHKIGAATTSGASPSHYDPPTGSSEPSGIAASGGFVWFTEFAANKIGRSTTTGAIEEFSIPTPGSGASAITTGPDGALWFTESDANKIGRITTGGTVTNEFQVAAGSHPDGIAAGPPADPQALWFTEFLGNQVGRIATAPPFVPPPPPPPGSSVPPPAAKKTAKKCKVPRLRGLTKKKAQKKLKKAGCKYRIRCKGRVRSTVPKAGRTTTKRVIVKCKRKKAKRTGRRATAGGRLIAAKGGLQ